MPPTIRLDDGVAVPENVEPKPLREQPPSAQLGQICMLVLVCTEAKRCHATAA
jgi:hypothetical protein